MNDQGSNIRVRPDLVCLSIGKIKNMLDYLSEQQGLSASSYIRQMVIKEFKKERKKELASVDA